ncbi:hypothetical protein E1292_40115 [Nonomuraea deserti]|uniref:ESX-1 secretion-associated protein n=1 Tax=Nonomuraea deserti TaxID=1848322 RepID=A0A4R4UPS7_9ACTN|nr:hypothetical protein [Nonomuraea deserti]TDC94258.1 hypothetical protein E1292_40115 [Nonomuraea deserti]
MTELEISLGLTGENASRVRTHAEEHHAALDPLVQRGDGVSSFGDDGTFGMFIALYAECREVSMAVRQALSTVMQDTGDGMHLAVRNTTDAEIAGAEGFRDTGAAWA